MKTRLLAGLLIAASVGVAADREFDRIVNTIETHYGVKRMKIPLMGLANLFVKVGQPAGTSSVKVAIFEDLGTARESYDPLDVDQLYEELTRSGLRPLVRVESHRSGESTFICTGATGKTTTLVVATFERNDATVVEVKMNLETMSQILMSPEKFGGMFGRHDSW